MCTHTIHSNVLDDIDFRSFSFMLAPQTLLHISSATKRVFWCESSIVNACLCVILLTFCNQYAFYLTVTDGTTGNVDNGNTEPTIGGPGVDEPSASTPIITIGGLNSASQVGSSSVSFITTVSVLLCALSSKLLY